MSNLGQLFTDVKDAPLTVPAGAPPESKAKQDQVTEAWKAISKVCRHYKKLLEDAPDDVKKSIIFARVIINALLNTFLRRDEFIQLITTKDEVLLKQAVDILDNRGLQELVKLVKQEVKDVSQIKAAIVPFLPDLVTNGHDFWGALKAIDLNRERSGGVENKGMHSSGGTYHSFIRDVVRLFIENIQLDNAYEKTVLQQAPRLTLGKTQNIDRQEVLDLHWGSFVEFCCGFDAVSVAKKAVLIMKAENRFLDNHYAVMAVQEGAFECLRFFLFEVGLDAFYKDSIGMQGTLLHIAAYTRRPLLAKFLADHYPDLLHKKDKIGETPLTSAQYEIGVATGEAEKAKQSADRAEQESSKGTLAEMLAAQRRAAEFTEQQQTAEQQVNDFQEMADYLQHTMKENADKAWAAIKTAFTFVSDNQPENMVGHMQVLITSLALAHRQHDEFSELLRQNASAAEAKHIVELFSQVKKGQMVLPPTSDWKTLKELAPIVDQLVASVPSSTAHSALRDLVSCLLPYMKLNVSTMKEIGFDLNQALVFVCKFGNLRLACDLIRALGPSADLMPAFLAAEAQNHQAIVIYLKEERGLAPLTTKQNLSNPPGGPSIPGAVVGPAESSAMGKPDIVLGPPANPQGSTAVAPPTLGATQAPLSPAELAVVRRTQDPATVLAGAGAASGEANDQGLLSPPPSLTGKVAPQHVAQPKQ